MKQSSFKDYNKRLVDTIRVSFLLKNYLQSSKHKNYRSILRKTVDYQICIKNAKYECSLG
jgi:hypothetical protein